MTKPIRGQRASLPLYDNVLEADIERALEQIKIREKYEYLAEHPYITEEEEKNESKTDN